MVRHIDYYLVTLRKHQCKSYVSFNQLDRILKSIDSKTFNIKDYCYEAHGVHKQLHAHFIVQVPKGFYYRDYVNIAEGFIMHFRIIDNNLLKVSKYIHKHCNNHSPEQIEQTRWCNYYKYHYGF